MLESFQKLAKAENRTMSELVREALRNYEKQKRRELIAEARQRAEARGIKDKDVVLIVRDYRRESARNMGKNDIWIAATALYTKMPLMTTDKDFRFLHDNALQVMWIDPDGAQTLN